MSKKQTKLTILWIGLCLALLCLAGAALAVPNQRASAFQVPIYTPTPGPDGKIIYIVKANDTLLSISLLTGVSVDKLRELNNLSGDTIIEGQPLLLGLSGPLEVTPTPGPSPTPTALLPTATQPPGIGILCILLFNDLNGDSLRQENELAIPDGAISINNRSGSFTRTGITVAGEEAVCFKDIPEGAFEVSVAAPEGYNATTESNYSLRLQAGDETYIDFGAQVKSSEPEQAAPAEVPARSPLLGIIGGVLLLAAVGLGVYARRILK